MDMDWDQIATVAQLVTGAATLAVAGFLSSQLRIQHRDSERDFAFANETKQQDLVASYYSDESAANLFVESVQRLRIALSNGAKPIQDDVSTDVFASTQFLALKA